MGPQAGSLCRFSPRVGYGPVKSWSSRRWKARSNPSQNYWLGTSRDVLLVVVGASLRVVVVAGAGLLVETARVDRLVRVDAAGACLGWISSAGSALAGGAFWGAACTGSGTIFCRVCGTGCSEPS